MVKFRPDSLNEALDIVSKNEVVPYAGGTDLMIHCDENVKYLFLDKIQEIKNIKEDTDYIRIGAMATYTEILESDISPQVLKDAVAEIAAPAIRNMGTLGGNVCNGSPKADGGLVLFAVDAKLRLVSTKGERVIPITDFYLGRNKTSREKDELLAEILINKIDLSNYYYKKVGARNALAISRVSFAAILNVEEGKIIDCKTAFGAVSNVIIRRPDIDSMFIGKTIEEAKVIKADYLNEYNKNIDPIRGRISAEYRKTVCMNLLKDFLESNGI